MAELSPDTAIGLPRFTRVQRFAKISGYSKRAIYLKIQRGVGWTDENTAARPMARSASIWKDITDG